MASLARAHQVVTITHLPQVAAQAATHFVVTKEVADGRTRSLLEPVEGDDRVAELARMLGGKSKSALEHARALLAGA
jgi:DNA repair protein RecN (Recombination protein N)